VLAGVSAGGGSADPLTRGLKVLYKNLIVLSVGVATSMSHSFFFHLKILPD